MVLASCKADKQSCKLRMLRASCKADKRSVHPPRNTRCPAFTILAAFALLAGSRTAMALLDQWLTVLTGYY